MAFLQKSLEPLTALGCGLAAGAAGVLDGGLAAGAVVGLAGLISRFREGCARHGLDEPALLKKMQMQMLRKWDEHDLPQADRDIITLADAAMAKHLPDCMLSRAELANTSVDADEPYPQKASRLIADQLAKRDAMFSATFAETEPLARRFARAAVECALHLAREDKDYAILLTVDLLLAGNRAHAVTHEKLDAQDAKRDAQHEERKAFECEVMARLDALGRPAGVSDVAFFEIAARAGAITNDVDAAVAQIHAAFDRLLAHDAAAVRGSNFGASVDEPRSRIAELNSLGKFNEAAAEGERAFAALAEQEDAVKAAKLAIVATNIDSARIGLDADALVRWSIEQFVLTHGAARVSDLVELWEKVFDDGWHRFLPLELDFALKLAEAMIALGGSREDAGLAQIGLGCAAWRKGERTVGAAGRALIARAAEAFERSLELYDRKQRPLEWAMTQNNLAGALTSLSARSEKPNSPGRIDVTKRAIKAYKAALLVFAERAMLAEMAIIQNNLGLELHTLAELTAMPKRHDLLTQAIAAFDDALLAYGPESRSPSWAMVHTNRVKSVLSLAAVLEKAEGEILVDLAIRALLPTLSVFRKTAKWADLANALSILGAAHAAQAAYFVGKERCDRFRKAIEYYDQVLVHRSFAATPNSWASTRWNMGSAYCELARETEGYEQTDWLKLAEAAFDDANLVMGQDDADGFDADCAFMLEQIRNALAACSSG